MSQEATDTPFRRSCLWMYAAYAFYFDHKRRTDPEFRKALKRESKKEARAAKEEEEAHGRSCSTFYSSAVPLEHIERVICPHSPAYEGERSADLGLSAGAQQKHAIKAAVAEAREEGFPTSTEDKEAYFMNEVGRGEALCQDGMRSP